MGIVLTATSLLVMPVLGVAKQRLARQLSSRATHGEGTQNLLCAYLSAAVLAGLLGSALLGLWWLDPLAALVVAAVAARRSSRPGAAKAASTSDGRQPRRRMVIAVRTLVVAACLLAVSAARLNAPGSPPPKTEGGLRPRGSRSPAPIAG